MRKTLIALAFVWVCTLPSAGFAATDPCRGLVTSARKADQNSAKADRTVEKLQGKLARKMEQFANKQASYQQRSDDCYANAQALNVKLATCSTQSGIVNMIWDSSEASSATCVADSSFLGHMFGAFENGLDCAATCFASSLMGANYDACYSQCQDRNGKQAARCQKQEAQVCSQIVKYRAKSEGYQAQKVNYNPTCTSINNCPNGQLRSLFVLLHGEDGTDNTSGAIYNQKLATAVDATANAALLCCQQTQGASAYNPDTHQCVAK